jgi:hypothetical protein
MGSKEHDELHGFKIDAKSSKKDSVGCNWTGSTFKSMIALPPGFESQLHFGNNAGVSFGIV